MFYLRLSAVIYYDGDIPEAPNIKTKRLGRNKIKLYYQDVFAGSKMTVNIVFMENRLGLK